MYTWIHLNSGADVAHLASHVSSEYDAATVAKTLSNGISDAVKAVLIESDYVDKDYRSTYYNFYAKKGQRYRSDCVRLHFFDHTVSFDSDKLALSCPDNEPGHHYFGYMVLRPTGIATIGRTVLSSDIRRGANRLIITAAHKVHLLGYRLEIHGFPSTLTSRCAHMPRVGRSFVTTVSAITSIGSSSRTTSR